jgi:tetratricopeptide (TPR) repeat protein
MSMWGRLRLGQAFDVLGRHGEAMKQYQLAHDLDASDSARDRTGARLDAGRRDSSLVSLVELEEDAGILRGSRRGQAELIDTVEALVTEPSRGMSGTETDLYFEVLATLAEARLRRGDPAGAVAAVDRAIERRPRPDKRNRARLLGVRARALWRLGDAAGASDDLSRARSLSAGDTRDRWEQERDLLDRLVAGLPAPADSGDAELRFEVQDRGELLLEAEFPDGRRFPLRLENGTWRGSWRTGDTEPVLYRFRVDGRFPRPDLHAERVTLRGDQAWCIATPQPTQTKSSPSQ